MKKPLKEHIDMKCNQKKCAFLRIGVGCRECDECHASPYILDEICYRCWNCSHDEGILRWDENGMERKEAMMIRNFIRQ